MRIFLPALLLSLISLLETRAEEIDGDPPALEEVKKRLSSEERLKAAQKLEEEGRLDEAIGEYNRLFARNSTGVLKSWQMPAAKGLFQSMWKRNAQPTEERVSGRQWAYQKLDQFLERTERLKPKMSDEELQQWKELAEMKQLFEKSGDVEVR